MSSTLRSYLGACSLSSGAVLRAPYKGGIPLAALALSRGALGLPRDVACNAEALLRDLPRAPQEDDRVEEDCGGCHWTGYDEDHDEQLSLPLFQDARLHSQDASKECR
ncbi:hypothetical protein NDU88_009868 [Pleurodeles waltl]|uniref:Uncharacterized protein n=1 Tax=Pleurodeles waltl TaxID=8319 RepID=A0AAV7QWL6_PLEWA|nr:hypothetical protein NDU88_009868 [Pleurodeles waltl]